MSEEEKQQPCGRPILGRAQADENLSDKELLKELLRRNPNLSPGELMDEIMRRNHPGMIAFVEAAREELLERGHKV